MLKTIAIIESLVCIFMLSACGNRSSEAVDDRSSNLSLSTDSKISQLHQPKSTYMKPGAAIRFNHNYDGKTEVGDVETIQLSFKESYSSGQMQVTLQPDPALSIEPAIENYQFSMDSDKSHQLEIAVSATSEGKHFLNIFTSATDESGQSKTRVFAIAFYVGNNFRAEKINSNKTSSADNLRYLPSRETVIK
jgi:hypothetical protein